MITTYAELQTAIANWLIKTNLTATIPQFIQLCEARLRRDRRARKLQNTTMSVSTQDHTLPSDFHSLESLTHSGPTYFGEIQIVPADRIPAIRARLGTTGVPAYGAILDTIIRFGPAPDATYQLKFSYWRKLDALSATNTTNWMLLDHPDVYLYGALLEAAPFLKDDARIPVWRERYEAALEELHAMTQDNQFGGGSSRRHYDPIG